MFFKKKDEPIKEMIEISGHIDRVSTYVGYSDLTILIFTLKERNEAFYLRYAMPKQTLTRENDIVKFKVEKGIPTNTYYNDEMVEAHYTSFINLSLNK